MEHSLGLNSRSTRKANHDALFMHLRLPLLGPVAYTGTIEISAAFLRSGTSRGAAY